MDIEKYKVSIETHKFYDSISITIVAGIISVSGACVLLLEKIQCNEQKAGVLINCAIVITVLLFIYRKCSYYANVARNVAAKFEVDQCLTGVSDVLKNLKQDDYKDYRADKKFWRGIYGAVHLLWALLFIGLILYAYTYIVS